MSVPQRLSSAEGSRSVQPLPPHQAHDAPNHPAANAQAHLSIQGSPDEVHPMSPFATSVASASRESQIPHGTTDVGGVPPTEVAQLIDLDEISIVDLPIPDDIAPEVNFLLARSQANLARIRTVEAATDEDVAIHESNVQEARTARAAASQVCIKRGLDTVRLQGARAEIQEETRAYELQ
ncbi:hypothetical protein BOTBODRAFT_33479 [Botryobasidium botryosum FD-172 SS1]|uniref:Uncharacterized protein n=1 Tax=Botryobasidium botryosum (strain FD-172 SS1) TaxID=930990 RepID=A0A067MFJ0_BOTB1|nr:hypothetical protein BOTBODRAFT_33479 [Botryobasidium botryosum FD-172 SS1]